MHFDIERSVDGRFLWLLVGGNGETMAVSETLSSKQACREAIATVKREAAAARVHDHTGDIHRP
jgi:uncharacterized protein YegP (UPF0339 family)